MIRLRCNSNILLDIINFMSNHSYLKVALEAVKEADIVINKYYSKDIKTTLKSDLSPVTIADKESETIIRKIIKINNLVHINSIKFS